MGQALDFMTGVGPVTKAQLREGLKLELSDDALLVSDANAMCYHFAAEASITHEAMISLRVLTLTRPSTYRSSVLSQPPAPVAVTVSRRPHAVYPTTSAGGAPWAPIARLPAGLVAGGYRLFLLNGDIVIKKGRMGVPYGLLSHDNAGALLNAPMPWTRPCLHQCTAQPGPSWHRGAAFRAAGSPTRGSPRHRWGDRWRWRRHSR